MGQWSWIFLLFKSVCITNAWQYPPDKRCTRYNLCSFCIEWSVDEVLIIVLYKCKSGQQTLSHSNVNSIYFFYNICRKYLTKHVNSCLPFFFFLFFLFIYFFSFLFVKKSQRTYRKYIIETDSSKRFERTPRWKIRSSAKLNKPNWLITTKVIVITQYHDKPLIYPWNFRTLFLFLKASVIHHIQIKH